MIKPFPARPPVAEWGSARSTTWTRGTQAHCVSSHTHAATKLPCLLSIQMYLFWRKLPDPPALQSNSSSPDPPWQMAGTHPAKSLDAAWAPVLEH